MPVLKERLMQFLAGGQIYDANLTILRTIRIADQVSQSVFQVRHDCCGTITQLTYAQIRERISKASKSCIACKGGAPRSFMGVRKPERKVEEWPQPNWPIPPSVKVKTEHWLWCDKGEYW